MDFPNPDPPPALAVSSGSRSPVEDATDRKRLEALSTRLWRAVLDVRSPGLDQRYWEAALEPAHYRAEGGPSPRGDAVLKPLEQEMVSIVATLAEADDAQIRAVLLQSDDPVVREAALLESPEMLRRALYFAVEI